MILSRTFNGRQYPEAITSRYDSKRHFVIIYDKAVKKEDQIEGLVDFLQSEYECLLETQGRFILDERLLKDKDFKTIPVILSSECPIGKTYRADDDWVAKTIVREFSNGYSEEEKEAIIKRVLKDRSFTPWITGMYYHDGSSFIQRNKVDYNIESPCIVLYYRNTISQDEEEYKAWIAANLAHEYFHYLHDLYAGDEFNKKGYRRDRVVEALADFFAFMYSLHAAETGLNRVSGYAREKAAKDKYDRWVYRFGTKWPYAYAYCMFFDMFIPAEYSSFITDYWKNGCKLKFNEVLGISKQGMKYAYKRLMLDVLLED